MLKRMISYLLLLFIFAGSTIAWAAEGFEDIRIYYSPLKILLDDKEIIKEEAPFIYQNRIYVSLRAAAEALGYEVLWDDHSKAATLSSATVSLIEACDPFKGEYFVYGQILSIDYVDETINIDQHLDDNSREVYTQLPLYRNAIIVLQRGSKQFLVDFSDVKAGDTVSLIITKENTIRSMIIDI